LPVDDEPGLAHGSPGMARARGNRLFEGRRSKRMGRGGESGDGREGRYVFLGVSPN
jgi:hypothetical protein